MLRGSRTRRSAPPRPQCPLLGDLRPVVQPDCIVCLHQPSRFQSWLTHGDHIASAHDRFLKATAIEQRFIQIKGQKPEPASSAISVFEWSLGFDPFLAGEA